MASRSCCAGKMPGLGRATQAERSRPTLMFGVAPTDQRVYALVALTVLGAVVVAEAGQVLRAGALEPAEVMRSEKTGRTGSSP